jgi:ABC-2 type transport system ATP-binding protein
MLLGLIRPHAGEVFLFGQPLQKNRLAVLGRVGALVESPSLYPHLTGYENMELTRRLCGARREAIDQALEIVNLQEAAHRKAGQYSLGMQQRLGLALALLNSPELLILDEPTNGLDPAGIHEMRALIGRLAQGQGITVFISSHLLSEVEQVATHIGILQQGRLLFQGTLEALHAEVEVYATLEVDQPQRAAMVLSQAGWMVRPDGSHRLAVTVNGVSDAALLNGQLVRAGVNVYHLVLSQPSLEDIFLALTGSNAGKLEPRPA